MSFFFYLPFYSFYLTSFFLIVLYINILIMLQHLLFKESIAVLQHILVEGFWLIFLTWLLIKYLPMYYSMGVILVSTSSLRCSWCLWLTFPSILIHKHLWKAIWLKPPFLLEQRLSTQCLGSHTLSLDSQECDL